MRREKDVRLRALELVSSRCFSKEVECVSLFHLFHLDTTLLFRQQEARKEKKKDIKAARRDEVARRREEAAKEFDALPEGPESLYIFLYFSMLAHPDVIRT